ncbi:hypothetical protein D1646_02615 [Pseudoflavonifractor sp. 60]|nr:hypothetical protein [Pseudoflavonifractor sp. 60]
MEPVPRPRPVPGPLLPGGGPGGLLLPAAHPGDPLVLPVSGAGPGEPPAGGGPLPPGGAGGPAGGRLPPVVRGALFAPAGL